MSEAECQHHVAEREREQKEWDERWKRRAEEEKARKEAEREMKVAAEEAKREAEAREEKEKVAAVIAAVEVARGSPLTSARKASLAQVKKTAKGKSYALTELELVDQFT